MIKREEKKLNGNSPFQIQSKFKPLAPKRQIIKKTEIKKQTNVSTANNPHSFLMVIGNNPKMNNSYSTAKKEVGEPLNLNIKLVSTEELRKKIKEIEDILKVKPIKINLLTLSTSFNSDNELGVFSQQLKKLISKVKVRNLKWVIKGVISQQLEDRGSGKLIGQVLNYCQSLYSLHLEVIFPILDSSASELASSLVKLKDLKILKLWIINPSVWTEYFTHVGNKIIKDSIQKLNQLQVLEYNNIEKSTSWRFINFHNITWIMSDISRYDEHDEYYDIEIEDQNNDEENYERNKKKFTELIQGKENQITSISLENNIFSLTFRNIIQDDDDTFDVFFDQVGEEISYKVHKFHRIMLGFLDQIFSLPYLTSYKVSYFSFNYHDFFSKVYPDEKLTKKELILKALINQKFQAVSRFILLSKHIYNEIPLNPNLLFSDLYFN